MFPVDRWAEAFIDVAGDSIEESVRVLEAVAPALCSLSPAENGLSRARAVDDVLQKALAKCAIPQSPSVQNARALVFLLVKRDFIREINLMVREIHRKWDDKRHILHARLDVASPVEDAAVKPLSETLKRKSKAAGVSLRVEVKPDLIGGCRLTVGNEQFDYSIQGGLRQLSEHLLSCRQN
jgi:ATP synthase F1 delta subunit